MSHITNLHARRVWDSRGVPTVEVDIHLDTGRMGRAIAPSGASRGRREALELRDGGDDIGGKDVQKAIANINGPIARALIGKNPQNQTEIDQALLALDPSPLKDTIGGNAITATSMAVLHAGASDADLPLFAYVAELAGTTPSLPLPEIQIFGGGAHAGRRVDIQDFMIMVPGAASFEEAMRITREVYFAAGDIMARRGQQSGIADEGGWWPAFKSNEEALETLVQAIELAGETPGKNVVISLDIAASEFGESGQYKLALDNKTLSSDEMIALLANWIDAYPIASIEDPLAEDDIDGMVAFTKQFGDRLQIIGDDYLVTNASLVERAITDRAANAVLIKVNQIGTITEAIDTFFTAKKAAWGTIVSARSGETEDVTISHLSTGLGAGQLKVGSFQRSERMVKWNECLRIQESLGSDKFVAGAPLANSWWAKSS